MDLMQHLREVESKQQQRRGIRGRRASRKSLPHIPKEALSQLHTDDVDTSTRGARRRRSTLSDHLQKRRPSSKKNLAAALAQFSQKDSCEDSSTASLTIDDDDRSVSSFSVFANQSVCSFRPEEAAGGLQDLVEHEFTPLDLSVKPEEECDEEQKQEANLSVKHQEGEFEEEQKQQAKRLDGQASFAGFLEACVDPLQQVARGTCDGVASFWSENPEELEGIAEEMTEEERGKKEQGNEEGVDDSNFEGNSSFMDLTLGEVNLVEVGLSLSDPDAFVQARAATYTKNLETLSQMWQESRFNFFGF